MRDPSDVAETLHLLRYRPNYGASAFSFLKKFGGRPPRGVKVPKMAPILEGSDRRPVADIDLIPTPVPAATPELHLRHTSRGCWTMGLASNKPNPEEEAFLSTFGGPVGALPVLSVKPYHTEAMRKKVI